MKEQVLSILKRLQDSRPSTFPTPPPRYAITKELQVYIKDENYHPKSALVQCEEELRSAIFNEVALIKILSSMWHSYMVFDESELELYGRVIDFAWRDSMEIHHDVSLLKFFLEAGANPAKHRVIFHDPITSISVHCKGSVVAEGMKLVHKFGADIHKSIYPGYSQLRIAVESDNCEAIRCLVDLNADVHNICDIQYNKDQPSLLYFFNKKEGNINAMKLLLDLGVNPCMQNRFGQVAREYLIELKRDSQDEYSTDSHNAILTMLENAEKAMVALGLYQPPTVIVDRNVAQMQDAITFLLRCGLDPFGKITSGTVSGESRLEFMIRSQNEERASQRRATIESDEHQPSAAIVAPTVDDNPQSMPLQHDVMELTGQNESSS